MVNSKLDFLTVINSIMLLADYQPNMIKALDPGDRTEIKKAAVASAKTACMLHVPVVYTSINPEENGAFINELTDIFPKTEVISRSMTQLDALENKTVLRAVRNSGRNKLIVSGLWTSMCFAFTAIHGIHEGLDVYGLIEAGGDATQVAHKSGVKRMLQAGVIPITWMSLASEWMGDWAYQATGESSKKEYGKYEAMLSMLAKE